MLESDVFKLLDEISQQNLPDSLAQYLIEFKALFSQLNKDLNL